MSSSPRRRTPKAEPDDTLPTDKLAAFGINLRETRMAKGMTQIDLANLAGLTDRAHLGKIEAGRINLSFRTMEQIANALGVTISDLIGPENGVA